MNPILIILKGAAMGMAEVIPGVSGGTIAFITGIYERLLNCIKAFSPALIGTLRKSGIKGAWQAIDGSFLMFLLIGMGSGVIVGVFGVSYLYTNFNEVLMAFFFGLIIASAIYIGKQIPKWGMGELIGLILGTAVAFSITILPVAQGSDSLFFIFICGALAISALILPGISGSFILLLMGMYVTIIHSVKDMLKTFATDKILTVAVFGAGALVGLLTFSRVVSWTFKNYRGLTLATMTGFMIGSLNKIWPWQQKIKGLTEEGTLTTNPEQMDKVIETANMLPTNYAGENYLLFAILAAIVGFGIVFLLDRFGTKETNLSS